MGTGGRGGCRLAGGPSYRSLGEFSLNTCLAIVFGLYLTINDDQPWYGLKFNKVEGYEPTGSSKELAGDWS